MKELSVGQAIRNYRVERDLTIFELVSMVNKGLPRKSQLHPSTISKLENGITNPNQRTRFKLVRAFPEIFKKIAETGEEAKQ